tara:strand:+ start:1893 stop:2267 length:375 start_codon:yes stop_codon:yes gene_type:complete
MTIRYKATKTQETEYYLYTVKKERLRAPRTLAEFKVDPRVKEYWQEDDEVKHWAWLRAPWRADRCITICSATVAGLIFDLTCATRVDGWTRYCWDTCNEGSFADYLASDWFRRNGLVLLNMVEL